MTTRMPSRTEALDLLRQWNQNESLIKHALAVEGVMRLMARRRGEDEEAWGIVGLVHDLDYERHPEAHCAKSREILTEEGWPESLVRAVVSHGWGICSDVEPVSAMERTLYAVDELVGLVTAAALVRPSRSVLDLEPSSVAKKWKDKRFAAGANREVIERGAQMLGLPLADLLAEVIAGMREVADAIDLRGTL
jgi:putative nucleotidyltransferase with HDIG domain